MQSSPELQRTTNHCDFPYQDVKLFKHVIQVSRTVVDGRTDLLYSINCRVYTASWQRTTAVSYDPKLLHYQEDVIVKLHQQQTELLTISK